MSLVYTTLLALVPLLAVCFSVLKGFGVHQQIEPVLAGFLSPLGERGDQVTQQVISFVENVQVGVLGSAGLAFLIYTVLSLIQKVERAFNEIWRAEQPRPLGQRLSRYLSALLVGPVLVVSILGMTASAASSNVVQWLLDVRVVGPAVGVSFKLVPYALVIGGFTLVYACIPNTPVRFTSAFVAALFAGLTWETAGLGFASFVANSGRYDAIYSGFAILLLFLVWTYLSWFILLAGASLAFHLQEPGCAHGRPEPTDWERVRIGLRAVERVVERFRAGEPQESAGVLAQHLGLSAAAVEDALAPVVSAGWLIRTEDPPVFVPARAPESIPITALVSALRWPSSEARASLGSAASALLAGADRAFERAFAGHTMADLGRREGAEPAVEAPASAEG